MYGLPQQTISLQKDCLSQTSLGPFLNTWSHFFMDFYPNGFSHVYWYFKEQQGREKGDKQKKPLSLYFWQGPEYSPIRPNTQLVAFKLATTSFFADGCNYRAICSNIYVLFTASGIFLLLQHICDIVSKIRIAMLLFVAWESVKPCLAIVLYLVPTKLSENQRFVMFTWFSAVC